MSGGGGRSQKTVFTKTMGRVCQPLVYSCGCQNVVLHQQHQYHRGIVRNACKFWPHPRLTESETLGMEVWQSAWKWILQLMHAKVWDPLVKKTNIFVSCCCVKTVCILITLNWFTVLFRSTIPTTFLSVHSISFWVWYWNSNEKNLNLST